MSAYCWRLQIIPHIVPGSPHTLSAPRQRLAKPQQTEPTKAPQIPVLGSGTSREQEPSSSAQTVRGTRQAAGYSIAPVWPHLVHQLISSSPTKSVSPPRGAPPSEPAPQPSTAGESGGSEGGTEPQKSTLVHKAAILNPLTGLLYQEANKGDSNVTPCASRCASAN